MYVVTYTQLHKSRVFPLLEPISPLMTLENQSKLNPGVLRKWILLLPSPWSYIAHKLRDKVLGQGIVTLFREPADQEDGGLVPQRPPQY